MTNAFCGGVKRAATRHHCGVSQHHGCLSGAVAPFRGAWRIGGGG